MAKQNVALLSFNRGILSRYGLSRTDLRRAALSAEIFTNYMPSVLGSMMLRPGLAYISTILNNAVSVQIPFIFSTTDTALLEMTNLKMRVRVNDVLVTREAVTTVIAEGTFATIATWIDADETEALSDNTGGKLNLTGTGYNAAIRRQLVTVPAPDLNKRHALRIVIERGPVTFKAGSTAGGEEYITTTNLKAGTHSLTLTPGGDFYVEFSSVARASKYVISIAIEVAGNLELPTIWTTADLPKMRWDQSADIIYVDCDGRAPQAIERRDDESWSIVEHFPLDGPFRSENISKTTISASATAGDVMLAASKAVFKPGHVGALFQMTSNGQTVIQVIAGPDQYTDPVRITGVGNPARNYTTTIAGTFSGTISLQRSHDDGVTWSTIFNWTGTQPTVTETDTLDNQIVLYRIGFVGANYVSGSATVTVSITGGGITGVARITGWGSPTSVTAAVTEPLGGIVGTELWSEGAWSAYRGYPTAVALHDGRLFHAGRSSIWGSVSDAYESHDTTVEGDAGPINRSIGRGPVDNINWLLPLLRLVLGAQGAEISARSSSLDEPLTPTNFNLKASSTQGSDAVPPGIVDDSGFFVEKSGQKVFRLELIPEKVSYGSFDQSQFVPDLLFPGVTRMAVQRQPNTRLHCILGDGTAAVLVYDNLEEVECWVLVETDGDVEDIVVLPGDIEDQVYYVIARTIGGSTVRYLEKWAREDQARGGATNRLADSHVYYSGSATAAITGLGHLEGESVVAWGNSKDLSPDDVDGNQTAYTVSGGSVTLPEAVTSACVGLPYRARFKSAKMAYASELGTALTQTKKIHRLGLILCDAHPKAIQYGQDFDHLDSMPGIEEETDVVADALWTDYDKPNFPLNGTWDTDARLCLQTKAPRPVTVTCAVATVQTIEG